MIREGRGGKTRKVKKLRWGKTGLSQSEGAKKKEERERRELWWLSKKKNGTTCDKHLHKCKLLSGKLSLISYLKIMKEN